MVGKYLVFHLISQGSHCFFLIQIISSPVSEQMIQAVLWIQNGTGRRTIAYTEPWSACCGWGIWPQARSRNSSDPGPRQAAAKWPVPILKAEGHVLTQKHVPLVLKTWKLPIASYVFSYTFQCNVWPHQSPTGNKWAKSINIYPGFCLIPFKPEATWYCLIPSLSAFSLTSRHWIPF